MRDNESLKLCCIEGRDGGIVKAAGSISSRDSLFMDGTEEEYQRSQISISRRDETRLKIEHE
jgi:hypothetical protein